MRRRALAATTIKRRVSNLWCFARAVDKPLHTVCKDDVERFLDARRLAPKSLYCWLSDLHMFYRWAVDEGHVEVDPTARIPRPRLPRSLPRPAMTADIAMAVQMADPRMRCWLLLMAYQGLRCQEVAYISRDDVLDTLDPPMLLVRKGKGAKERMEPLHPEVGMALRALPLPRAGRLWHVTEKTVSQKTNAFLRSLDIDATAHQLRHWFGTEAYRSSRDIRMVQELMGHESPVTTAGYARVVMDDAAPVVGSLSLRETKARHPAARPRSGLGSAHERDTAVPAADEAGGHGVAGR